MHLYATSQTSGLVLPEFAAWFALVLKLRSNTCTDAHRTPFGEFMARNSFRK